jgi:hypothetical protein
MRLVDAFGAWPAEWGASTSGVLLVNKYALVLGAALGFFITVMPSCGASRCSAANCQGCCDSNNACVALDRLSNSACGSQGNACSNCAAMNQTCNTSTRSCIAITPTGGGMSGTGGGTSSTGGGSSSTGGGGTGTGGGASGMYQACDEIQNPNCPAGTQCIITDGTRTAGLCLPADCNLVRQDCTAPNTKCVVGPFADGGVGPQCLSFNLGDGGTADFTMCTSAGSAANDVCRVGSQCLGGQPPTCAKFCSLGITNSCPAGSECNAFVTFQLQGGQTLPGAYRFCQRITPCNPYDQSPCANGEACIVYTAQPPYAACLTAGPVPAGGTCNNMTFCSRGTQCVSPAAGMPGTCRNFCNLDGGAPTCAAGMCLSLMGTPIGVCSM